MSTRTIGMPRPKKQPTESVKLSTEILKKIRLISTHLDMSISEWIADRLREPVEAEFAETVKQLNEQVKKRG